MKGYIFIANGTKPSKEKYESRDKIICGNYNKPCLKAALGLGYEVHLGVNRKNPEELECDMPVNLFESHTYRSITAFKDNYIAFKNFMKVLSSKNIDVIHCNTPVGGMIGRLCGKIKKVNKVIYTVHGFHFYKGAPLLNRTVLKWAEQIMAHWTDAIITINKDDFEIAKTLKLKKGGKVYYVPGVGIDTKDYTKPLVNRDAKRKEIGVGEDDFVIVSAGRLEANKNNKTIVKAVAKANNPKVKFVLCGQGNEKEEICQLAKELGIENQVILLGSRSDIKDIFKAVDCFTIASFREGLSRSLMEAMASGLPCIISRIRGSVDLIEDGVNGYSCPVTDVDAFSVAINNLAKDAELCERMKINNLEKIKNFDVFVVEQEIKKIYEEVLA